MQKIKLSTKLVLSFLMAGILPAAIIGTIAVWTATRDMQNQNKVTFATLRAVRDIKHAQLDQYFRQRERDEPFGRLVARSPQMLGIGVDEKTALVIRGSVAEVVGANGVSFYGRRGEREEISPVVLLQGASYDLVARTTLQ